MLPLHVGAIGGFALDAAGDIVVSDRTKNQSAVFAQNSAHPKRVFGGGLGSPEFMAFDATRRHLYVIEFQSSSSNIVEFAYATGHVTNLGGASEASFGIALSPAPQP